MGRFMEMKGLIDKIEERHKALVSEADELIAEVKKAAYYDSERNTYMALSWGTCGRAYEGCVWCPDGHGPYWRYSYYTEKNKRVFSKALKSITRQEMMAKIGNTRGYAILKEFDKRRKKIVKEIKTIREVLYHTKKSLGAIAKGD